MDICPCNICPCDICPYQEYLSCHWHDFETSLANYCPFTLDNLRQLSNWHFPCNICPGDICPYQQYLSYYRPDFDQTLKEGSWEHLEQIPTDLILLSYVSYVIYTNSFRYMIHNTDDKYMVFQGRIWKKVSHYSVLVSINTTSKIIIHHTFLRKFFKKVSELNHKSIWVFFAQFWEMRCWKTTYLWGKTFAIIFPKNPSK